MYAQTNEAWKKANGWPLFRPLHEDDAHVLAKIHVPAGDSQSEFDEQVLYLAKLVVDYLNERGITKALTNPVKGEKGIAKLERLLDEIGVSDSGTIIRPLANIQGLRSRGSAHAKGSDFDVTVAIAELSRREGIRQLMSDVVESLERLRALAEATGSASVATP